MNRKIVGFIVATVLMIVVMQLTGNPITTELTPRAIFDLEFAKDAAAANLIIDHWSSKNAVGAAITNTYWDFLFVICYCGLIFVLCQWVHQKVMNGTWASVAHFLAKAIIIAGLADYIENFLMLEALKNGAEEHLVRLTYALVMLKFLIIVLAILFLLLAFIFKRKTLWPK